MRADLSYLISNLHHWSLLRAFKSTILDAYHMLIEKLYANGSSYKNSGCFFVNECFFSTKVSSVHQVGKVNKNVSHNLYQIFFHGYHMIKTDWTSSRSIVRIPKITDLKVRNAIQKWNPYVINITWIRFRLICRTSTIFIYRLAFWK